MFEGLDSTSNLIITVDENKQSEMAESTKTGKVNVSVADINGNDKLTNGHSGETGQGTDHLVNDEHDQHHSDDREMNGDIEQNIVKEVRNDQPNKNIEVQSSESKNIQTEENKMSIANEQIKKASNDSAINPSSQRQQCHGDAVKSSTPTLMQSCIECYKSFFHTYITQKIIHDPNVITRCVDQMTTSTHHGWSYKDDDDSVLDSSSMYSFDLGFPSNHQDGAFDKTGSISADHLHEETLRTFDCACRLLLDYSSFPIFCMDFHKIYQRSFSLGNS